jgi:phospholipid/cholesterol/gamma-HCH transport system substrate-binding protein
MMAGRSVSDETIDRAAPPVAGGREIRIGVFVLLGAFTILFVLFLLTDPATFRGRYMIVTEVSDAGGTRKGDPVQMRGVNIGRVHEFDMAGPGVRIVLEVDGRWDIPEDSRIRLAGLDLMGGRTVEVIPGVSPRSVSPGATLSGESAAGVLDVADDVGRDVQLAIVQVRELLNDSAIASVHGSATHLEEVLSSLTQIVEEQRDDIAVLSASLNRSASRAESLLSREELDRSIVQLDSTLAEMRIAGSNLARATNSLEVVMGRIERGEGTLGRLSVDDSLYTELTGTLEQLSALAQDLRENPQRYVRLSIF